MYPTAPHPLLDCVHSYQPDEDACPSCGGRLYEILIRDGAEWLHVSTWIFRSWTGGRRIDGEPYRGPVYYLGSKEVARRALDAGWPEDMLDEEER